MKTSELVYHFAPLLRSSSETDAPEHFPVEILYSNAEQFRSPIQVVAHLAMLVPCTVLKMSDSERTCAASR